MNKIRELREQAELTQTELSKYIDLTQPRISELEHDKKTLKWKEAISIALFFNISLDYLAGLSANPSMNTQ